ncbi:GNAT family N-acetyltransferase [Qipengyuania spongiae]|uniref:GNAT family N-acetyltransferase n=1 Tax=Qipengyuania spongiae TaxID=2909673 RepID=A0ABY5SW03_9SPHN|nr:GNAT family N-acetyltransferase [Qipengyuania spongiae]UVI38384.1 GNAT family N-acetyltransferase [Qipengyuania spongiae]
MEISVFRLKPDHADRYRQLRCSALSLYPQYFGASLSEEAKLSDGEWAQRISDGVIFGAWVGDEMVACVGLASRAKKKLRHKAVLWGMFVDPERRGLGIGRRLLEVSLSYARARFEEVVLTVVKGNDPAAKLYASAGFYEYGREVRAIKVGGRYYDEILMRLPLAVKR